MRSEPKKVELDFNDQKVDVYFHQLKPSDSLIFLMFMAKIVGGSAGKFVGAMDGKSLTDLVDKTDLDMDKLGGAISGLFDRMDEKGTVDKINLLLKSVKHKGESLDIDGPFFDGNLPQLFKVVKIALGVNYKSFLDVISGQIKTIAGRMQSLKDTQKVQP